MIVVIMILILIAAAVGFVYHGTIFKPASAPVAPTNSSAQSSRMNAPSPSLPMPTGTNYWTLNIDAVGTPDVPAGGKVHGKFFMAERMILNGDGLTIRTANVPPDAGVTIYLRPDPIESVFGKTIVFEPNTPNEPLLNLRWKDAQGSAQQQSPTGYALRIEFGQPVGNSIPGKIYLCTPDETKSYVVGKFNAEIVKPKPQ